MPRENHPDDPIADEIQENQDSLLDTVGLLAEMPWPHADDEDAAQQDWQLGAFSGITAWGILRLLPLTGWSPPRPVSERDPLTEAMDHRWGTRRPLELDSFPDYDPDTAKLDVRSLLKLLVQYAGGNQALWWQATNRRIVVAVFDRREQRLLRRRSVEQLVGIIVAPTEILDPLSVNDTDEAHAGDPLGPLMQAIVGVLDEPRNGRDAPAPAGWESLALVVGLSEDGSCSESYGYVYGPGTAITAISVRSRLIEPELEAFLADRCPNEQPRPVKALFQLRITDGSYDVVLEYDDHMRWNVSPGRVEQVQEELRPAFD